MFQVLLYDPLFDWTMNPLKAFYLQHDEQQELNATLSSTMGGDNMVNQRQCRWVVRGREGLNVHLCVGKSCKRCVCVWQRQSELQQGGRAGAAAAPGEAEGGGGGHGAQCGGAGQPAHPTSHGPQEPQQTLPRVAGLGLDLRVCLCRIKSRFLPDSWGRCCADAMEETDTFSDRLFKIKTVHFISFAPDGTNFAL